MKLEQYLENLVKSGVLLGYIKKKIMELAEQSNPNEAIVSHKQETKEAKNEDFLLAEIDKHNEVTKTIIVGILTTDSGFIKPNITIRKADNIMKMLISRGYRPQINHCNQLVDGVNC